MPRLHITFWQYVAGSKGSPWQIYQKKLYKTTSAVKFFPHMNAVGGLFTSIHNLQVCTCAVRDGLHSAIINPLCCRYQLNMSISPDCSLLSHNFGSPKQANRCQHLSSNTPKWFQIRVISYSWTGIHSHFWWATPEFMWEKAQTHIFRCQDDIDWWTGEHFRRKMLWVIIKNYECVSQGSGSAVPTYKLMLYHTPAYHTLLNVWSQHSLSRRNLARHSKNYLWAESQLPHVRPLR